MQQKLLLTTVLVPHGEKEGSYFIQFITFLHWSFFKTYFHFYCNQPRSDKQTYCLLFLAQNHLGSVYQNSATGQSLYLLNLKRTSLFHCPSPPFILEDPTDRRQAAKQQAPTVNFIWKQLPDFRNGRIPVCLEQEDVFILQIRSEQEVVLLTAQNTFVGVGFQLTKGSAPSGDSYSLWPTSGALKGSHKGAYLKLNLRGAV